MSAFREEVAALADADDLLVVDTPLAETNDAFAVAAEAARQNGPAVRIDHPPGTGRVVCGAHGGPDRMARRETRPWSRTTAALGLARTTAYRDLLATLVAAPGGATVRTDDLLADERATDLTALALPATTETGRPLVTLGLAATPTDGGTLWAPVRGTLMGRRRLRVSVPCGFATAAADGPVALALGVPTGALLAAGMRWTATQLWRDHDPATTATALGAGPMAETAGGSVPASAEVVCVGRASASDAPLDGPSAAWEADTATATLDVTATSLAWRDDPLLPVAPLGEPLGDDRHLTGLVEGAALTARVNGYWGVSPVEWVGLPVEAGLGICLVASEVLYAGFEWQLANTLFAFSTLFDKVVILDADASFTELARSLDDLWVKAHPAHDWTFSEATAPAASVPRYRRDGETGARLYVDAAWDPTWEEEYIAPRVGFDTYPPAVRETARERWAPFEEGAE